MLFVFLTMTERKAYRNSGPAMLRLRRDLDALFARAKRVRSGNRYLQVRVLFREKTTSRATQYLFVAPKRTIRPAHERNTIKRWLREAVRTSMIEKQLQATLSENNIEALILIRVNEPPSARMNWDVVVSEVQTAFEGIGKMLPPLNTQGTGS